MKVRSYGIALLLALCIQWLAPEARLFGQAAQDPQGFQRDYTAGPSWFPSFYRPYQQQRIGPMILENSRRIADLIRDGNLELSLADALALALENNLDIAVARYVVPMAQTDILRTQSGQAATPSGARFRDCSGTISRRRDHILEVFIQAPGDRLRTDQRWISDRLGNAPRETRTPSQGGR